MIKINRKKTPRGLAKTNRSFRDAIAGMSAEAAYDFYKQHENTYRYNTDETKQHFREMNHERCSFCTKVISDFDDEMTVEHIRIKRDHPRLIFQWSNMLCACRTCNTKRGTRGYVPEKYLDPTKLANIEKYFSYQLDGTMAVNEELDRGDQEKADYMIKLYCLNRRDLVCKRREFLRKLMSEKHFYEDLEKLELSSQHIIFLSVFAYYRGCREEHGE